MLFVVYNDADETAHSRMGSLPLGAEIRQHVYGWDTPGALENTVFMEFTLKNKSGQTWNDTYFAIWSDPDIGYYGDDLIGFDVDRQMAYAYNGVPNDNIYGDTPPAVGYDLLMGTQRGFPTADAFSYYTSGGSGLRDPDNPYEVYNHLNGSLYPDFYPLSGDPVNPDGGDIDSDPADRRFLISTGEFGEVRHNEELSITVAIIVAQGLNNINSIYELDQASDAIQGYYNDGLFDGGAIENISTIELEPNVPTTLDDTENSGVVLTSTANNDGATVELVTFSGAPIGTENTEESLVHGVGTYLEINIKGTVIWPVELTMYYTADDLAEAGIEENELAGLYYYSSSERKWKLYSESGADDNGLGPSTTEVHTENITLNEVYYEGYVSAMAYHLTAIRMGSQLDSVLSIGINDIDIIPDQFYISQNYPNPFNPVTMINYQLPMTNVVELSIYNLLGQKVATLVSERKNAGFHQVEWHAGQMASGVYYYMIKAGEFQDVKKMVLLR